MENVISAKIDFSPTTDGYLLINLILPLWVTRF